MQDHREEFSISGMSRVLGASRAGYYAWRSRQHKPSSRTMRQQAVDAKVESLFRVRKCRYGSPRLARDLAEAAFPVSVNTVAASMQRQGLVAKAARKFKATTNSKHDLPVAPNLLQQDFTATAPNEKWVGDITYLWTDEGWLYLAVVIDLFSRSVIGWAMSERMKASLVCDALMSALWRRGMPKNVIVHSDRGSQYCSADYQKIIKRHDLRCSMSAKGNCYDNACAESFFHSMKVEAIHGERFMTRKSMRQEVFEYIEIDYNRVRRHSANGYLSPEVFEAQRVA
jgi:putative transposase